MTTEASAPEKYAIRKLLRLPNGTVGVFYVDAMTGAILDNLSGYALVTAGNLEGPEAEAGGETPKPTEEEDKNKGHPRRGEGGGSGYTPLSSYPNTKGKLSGPFPPAPSKNIQSVQEYANVNKIPLDKIPVPQPYDLNSYQTGYKQEYSNPGMSLTDAGRIEKAFPTEAASITSKSEGKSLMPMTGDIEDTTRPTPTMSSSGAASQEKYYGNVDPYQSLTDKTSSLMESVARTAAEQGTTATVNSGFRNDEHNDAVGGASGSLHQEGKSFDLDLSGMTDAQKQAILTDIAFQTMGTGSVGFYPGSEVIHVDAQRQFTPNPTLNPGVQNAGGMNVMYDRTQKNAYQNIPDWAKAAMTREAIGALAPIPTERPTQGTSPSSLLGNEKSQGLFSTYDIKDANLGDTSTIPQSDPYASKDSGLGGTPTVLPSGASGQDTWGVSATSKPTNEKTTAEKINKGVTNSLYNIPEDVDLYNMTPAQAASYGITGTRSPEQISGMAKVIAGEVMPQTITAAVKGDPVAMAELNSVIASMENRDYKDPSKGYSSMQYDANKAGNALTTAQNYGIYGPTLENYLNDFYSGKMSGVGNMAATSYYSPDGLKNLGLETPSWGPKMADVTPYGYQVFGSLPEYSSTYSPSSSFIDEVATDRINKSAGSSELFYGDMGSNPITSSPPSFFDTGDSYSSPYDAKDSGLGGTSATSDSSYDNDYSSLYDLEGLGFGGTSATSDSSYDNDYSSLYDLEGLGFGGVSATSSGGSTYDNSKDSGLGGTSATSGSSSSSGSGSYYDNTSVANGGGSDYSSLGSWF